VRSRGSGEDGAALVVVVLVLMTLMMFAAIAVDTAALVQERRELQNGADAAAMAVAQQCASSSSCGAYLAPASDIASANASDGKNGIDSICGTGNGLTLCSEPPGPEVPAGASYVRVTTKTLGADGSTDRVPFNFGKVFGQQGQTVKRSAEVAWGSPKSLTTPPFAISACDWQRKTGSGSTYATPSPPYPPWPDPGFVRTLYFHGTNGRDGDGDAEDCDRRNPSGQRVPGGFGWLDRNGNACSATTSTDAPARSDPGTDVPQECDINTFRSMKNTVVFIPVYDDVGGIGTNATYHITGYVAFYVISFHFNRFGYVAASDQIFGLTPEAIFGCWGNDTCVRGYFVTGQIVSNGTVGGPPMGVTVLQYVQ
jgi:hypothetical protein